MINIFADMHVHTKFSADGNDDMKDMCKSAIEKGVSYICFTDHFDMNPQSINFRYFNYKKFSEAINQTRIEFGDKIQILKGLEFSEPHLYPKEFESMLKKDFDFILGSIHWLGDIYVESKMLKEKYTIDQTFENYYMDVLKMVKFGGVDGVAHFDLPKRYIKESYDQLDIIDEILNELFKSDIALEINTASLRMGLNESVPDSNILQRYVRAGGNNKVTLGSDAHSYSEIAASFDYAYELIKKNKIEKVGIYKGHKFFSIM